MPSKGIRLPSRADAMSNLSYRHARLIVGAIVFICLHFYWIEPDLACERSLAFDYDKAREPDSFSNEQNSHGPVFPPKCTARDFNTISYQLPDHDCLRKQLRRPIENACSISYATRCPDALWFKEQYQISPILPFKEVKSIRSLAFDGLAQKNSPVAIHVGCNKAMDAVNTLRLISGDTKYNRTLWRDTLYNGQTVYPGVCQQDTNDDQLSANAQTVWQDAVVHCIEAMPVTAASLLKTSFQLGWQSNLVVTNVAMANADGTTLFPNMKDTIGAEALGLGDCNNTETRHLCTEVPVSRLDTFVAKHVAENAYIEFLSIDAEGYDFDVLLGAPETLKRSKYLEFEFHWVGTWKNYKLSTAINMLRDSGFVCYWAGAFGHVWRITDCWMDYYDVHTWSNVACVNLAIPSTAPLAARMEQLFQNTLGVDHEIQYNRSNTKKLAMPRTFDI
jgi:FkbM family methyltransferase